MAVTPGGTPYVESSDLVANYPATSLSLANKVDTKANTASPTFTGTVTIPDVNLLAWTFYTPTLDNWAKGTGGEQSGWYTKIGRLCIVKVRIQLGTAPTTTGTPLIGMPFNTQVQNFAMGINVGLWDESAGAFYAGGGFWDAPARFGVRFLNTSAGFTQGSLTGTTPFTWAVGDWLSATVYYETTS